MKKEEIDRKLRNLHMAFVGYKHRIMTIKDMTAEEKDKLIEEQRLKIEAKKKELCQSKNTSSGDVQLTSVRKKANKV